MVNERVGVEYQGKILVYTHEFDARRTEEKIKKGITKFGWSNKEIQPCLMMVEPGQFEGTIINA